jgi:hypothetical protein
MIRLLRLLAALGLFIFPLAGSALAQLTRNTTNIPTGNIGYTENVDFGDVDGDGDWDAVLADGGDFGNQQNRIWINQGGLQGGVLGNFLDATAARFPVILDDSRDIEFADIDNDGDLDIYVSNTSQVSQQSNHWWVNMGGAQGGTLGFYQDQSLVRWVNLGVNNATTKSSIAPSLVLAGGGFIDWSCDCDFGDIDNDGDLDLAHSTYGGAFGGDVPTRFFLNDGAGKYEEFNPSGFQLTGSTIANGNPGIWAAGTQNANTLNATGVNCDIAASALDIDLGDIDGDLDLDLLHGSRQEAPRMFINPLVENGGVLTAFRDVTGSAFPAGYSTGNGHYEQEMGDLDNDGDLDIYGLNWQVGFGLTDITIVNNGSGVYSGIVQLANSGSDDNEGDFLDYDMDGDLDLFVANFSGQERLYRNNFSGGGFSYTEVTATQLPNDGTISLDADCCDVDEDGDTDVFVANDLDDAEWYLQNQSTANDTFAPLLPNLEQAPPRAAGAAPTVIRVQVYDNAPYYINWYNATVLEYSVNGGAFSAAPMRSSAGQIFRGEIPGSLVGALAYRVKSSDKYGNTGTSATKSYNSSSGGCTGTPTTFCTAKTTGNGCVPAIGSSGTPSATAGSGFLVNATNMINNKSCLMFYGTTGQASGAFQGGILCVKAPIKRTPGTNTGGNPPPNNCSGAPAIDMNAFAVGALGGTPLAALTVPGTIVTCQWWGRDPGFAAPNNTQLTDGLQYTICP